MLLASIGDRIWANELPTIIYEDRLPHHVTNDDDMVSCIVIGQIFRALKDDGIRSGTVAIDHPAIEYHQRIGKTRCSGDAGLPIIVRKLAVT